MYEYKTDKLKNGLKLLKIPNKENSLIILTILFKTGNDVETLNTLEIGHFIEHLFSMFTSTKYPDGKINREQFAYKNIDLSAEIVNKQIKFSLEFIKKHSEYVIDLVSNALIDYKIDETMFKQEKNAVIEELNEIIKDSDYKFETKIDNIIYKGHQREYSQQQRLQNTKKVTLNDIKKYYNTFFTSKNFVIGIFGNLDVKIYKTFIKNLSLIKNNEYKFSKYSMKLDNNLIYYKKNSNISNLKIYFKVDSTIFDSIHYDIIALLDILSGDLNSLLLKELRNEKGLIYDCMFNDNIDEYEKGLSTLSFETLCNTNNLLKVIESIFKILKSIKSKYVDNKYITAYKSKITMYKIKDSITKKPESVLSNYLTYLLWNKPIVSFNNEYKHLSNISQETLLKLSNKIFKKENLIICYDGNKQLNANIAKIVSTF